MHSGRPGRLQTSKAGRHAPHRKGFLAHRSAYNTQSPSSTPPPEAGRKLDSSVGTEEETWAAPRPEQRNQPHGPALEACRSGIVAGGEDRPVPVALPRPRRRVPAAIRKPQDRQGSVCARMCQRMGPRRLRQAAHPMARRHRLPPVHPGEILREDLMAPLGLSINRLARDLRVPVARMSGILNGQRSISADTALRLGRYFATTRSFGSSCRAPTILMPPGVPRTTKSSETSVRESQHRSSFVSRSTSVEKAEHDDALSFQCRRVRRGNRLTLRAAAERHVCREAHERFRAALCRDGRSPGI
jgi:addiction module HigA family antidote